MPPRWLAIIIIAAWLSVTSWMLWTEVLPYWLPGTPPAFSIDLVEEAQQGRNLTRWVAERNGEKVFQVNTHVERTAAGVFEMGAEYKPHASRDKDGPARIGGLSVARMTSAYRVNLAGDLVGLSIHVEGETLIPFKADIAGEVRAGKLASLVVLHAGGQESRLPLPEVAVPRGGNALMPLHPVNRIRGLRPGQAWTLRFFDPLRAIGGRGEGMTLLRAAVRPQEETFTHGRRKSEPCLVIDYRGDEVEASTWVAVRTGLVLKQEATQDGETWVLYRD